MQDQVGQNCTAGKCIDANSIWHLDVIHTVFRLGPDDIHSRVGVGVARDAVRHVSL